MARENPPSRRVAALLGVVSGCVRRNRVLRFCWFRFLKLQEQLFDPWNRIDSKGLHRLDGLTITGPNGPESPGYEAVHPRVFFLALSSLGINFSEYVFVDFGSGKGRAVLMASRYPFKKVIGVEFARELHDVAQKNLRSWRWKMKCGSVKLFWADVLEFEIPQEPCVLFFFSPFSEVMLRRVLEDILRSIKVCCRDIIILYVHPAYEQAILSLPNVEAISKSSSYGYSAYRIRPTS
jgi:SAM-dependent methyltransferase